MLSSKTVNKIKDKESGELGLRVRNLYEYRPYPEVLKNMIVTKRDALEVIEEYKDDPAAVIYCDPPYFRTAVSQYSEIYEYETTEKIKLMITNPEYKCKIILHLEYTHDLFYRMKDHILCKYPRTYNISRKGKVGESQLYSLIVGN